MRGLITIEKLRPDGYEYPIGLSVAVAEIPSVNLATNITGGTQTMDGTNAVHSFTSSGFFDNQNADEVLVEYLVVAGGGGAGGGGGGGGGAEGLSYNSSYPVAASANLTIAVGSGGATALSVRGGNSSITFFGAPPTGNVLTVGGGAGGEFPAVPPGGPGGSGGGGAHPVKPGGFGTSGQGNNGGNTTVASIFGGGGGGAGAAGSNTTPTAGGTGGVGLEYSISGSPTFYAGGGGGGAHNNSGTGALGGNGGGGAGAPNSPTPGTAGTSNRGGGGGGGGGISGSVSGIGGAGGSGIVIVRYVKDTASIPGSFSIN